MLRELGSGGVESSRVLNHTILAHAVGLQLYKRPIVIITTTYYVDNVQSQWLAQRFVYGTQSTLLPGLWTFQVQQGIMLQWLNVHTEGLEVACCGMGAYVASASRKVTAVADRCAPRTSHTTLGDTRSKNGEGSDVPRWEQSCLISCLLGAMLSNVSWVVPVSPAPRED